ncbi:Rossmann-like and DUF2520 domain-containing protein [Mucilaginibacter paludis]|uniref:DUF2520 domain-containing protein n=1 Tax=Mucilaginibacter paludis DSM 18603 TaxID=714943 RepID=H1Y7I3_9SPHI|nr:Rossmann-like and DUF2520 domain-containing protein [Mucilaginibacter paludis]EHQ29404.1 protein of unknown function DUF2520-containing protein [Mucilaginibacter paludis DSM 18603]
MRVSIIGSGNVATHLSAALKNAGHHIIQVYSLNQQNAGLLAYHVKAEAISHIAQINADTDMFIIAAKDDAIESIAKQLASYQKLIVHTSGATAMDVILKYNLQAGILYPLQTFSKTRELDFKQVPLCIEGSTEDITIRLEQLAHTISKHVSRVNSSERKILHLAAVFACNFSNHLYAIAQVLLVENGLDFNLLKPLILETAQKVMESSPVKVQTGPAIRNDKKTMKAHLGLLDRHPPLQQLYEVLSQSIIKMGNGG